MAKELYTFVQWGSFSVLRYMARSGQIVDSLVLSNIVKIYSLFVAMCIHGGGISFSLGCVRDLIVSNA